MTRQPLHAPRRRPWTLFLALSALLVVAAPAPSADAATRPPDVPGTPGPDTSQEAAEADRILSLLNQARVDRGLAPLVRNPILDAAAKAWNTYMINGRCPASAHWPLCHQSRTAMGAMAKSATAPHGYRWWAENAQYTWQRADKAHQNFMGSSGHRANMLHPSANQVGIAVKILASGAMFVTEEFVEAKPPPIVNPCGRVTVTLRLKSKGASVRRLQCALALEGVYAGGETGVFDQATKAAVQAYQAAHGLKVTGIASWSTRRSMHLV